MDKNKFGEIDGCNGFSKHWQSLGQPFGSLKSPSLMQKRTQMLVQFTLVDSGDTDELPAGSYKDLTQYTR